MSIQANTYVMFGAVLPGDTFAGDPDAYERLEPYMDSAFDGIKHHDGLCVLYDGMNGAYVAIGEVIAKTDEYNQGFEEPVTIGSTPPTPHEELARKIDALLPANVQRPVLAWHVITHYR